MLRSQKTYFFHGPTTSVSPANVLFCACCRDSSSRKLESKLQAAFPAVSESISTASQLSNDLSALKARVAARAGDARHDLTVLQTYKRRAVSELEQLSTKRSRDAVGLQQIELRRAIEDEARDAMRELDDNETAINTELDAISKSTREKMSQVAFLMRIFLF